MTPYQERYLYQRTLFYRRKIKEIINQWKETERKMPDLEAEVLVLKNEHVEDIGMIDDVYKSFGRRIRNAMGKE